MQTQAHSSNLRIVVADDLHGVSAADWNALGAIPYPFLRHEFLRALETEGCLGESLGWIPHHLLAYDGMTLVGATPLYLKFNSYGEFVFDWSWADAYRRAGLDYYPKLVATAPYTPATGPKLLVASHAEPEGVRQALAESAVKLAEKQRVSSLHWLFSPTAETDWLTSSGLLRRTGCQFHWHNDDYRDVEAFLATFAADKRKKLKRERRRVAEGGIRFRLLNGDDASEGEWAFFHTLYADTFRRHGGIATLSLSFFLRLAELAPKAVLLVLAEDGRRPVAAAFCLVGADTLYGRHWGCREHYHSLHFEACYYQGIEYCIRERLAHFEPGAQGEHKISRGFLPTPTWSTHWIGDDRFRAAIDHFLTMETAAMSDYCAKMLLHSPYKVRDGARPAA